MGAFDDGLGPRNVLVNGRVRMQLPQNWTFSSQACGIPTADGTHSPNLACHLGKDLSVGTTARLAEDAPGYGQNMIRSADVPTTVDGHRARRGLARPDPHGPIRIGVLYLVDQHVVATVQSTSIGEINTLLAQVRITGPAGTASAPPAPRRTSASGAAGLHRSGIG